MHITLTEIPHADKVILRNLMELYLHDFEFDGEYANEHGPFAQQGGGDLQLGEPAVTHVRGYGYIDHYWTDEGRHPFLIRVDGRIAGFVLVRRLSAGSGPPEHSIVEFFVMKKYRRRGVGRHSVGGKRDTGGGGRQYTFFASDGYHRRETGRFTSFSRRRCP